MPDELEELANAAQVGKTADVTTTPQKPEGIEWVANGDVRFTWDGMTYTLRAPKLPGIMDLSDLMADMDRELQAARLDPGVNIGSAQVKIVIAGVRKMFVMFSSDKLPKADGALPAWLSNAQLFGWVSNHFRTVPLASGPSGPML